MADVATVTVAIPVYNGERYVGRAIQSALDQTTTASELLLFDNGSSDGTLRVARALLPEGSVHARGMNAGAVANFNDAVAEATGDFFAWLAADDEWEPDYLATCLKALEAQPERLACLTGIRFIKPCGSVIREHTDPLLGSLDTRPRLRSFLRRPRWAESYCLYRTAALRESPRFLPEYGADVFLTWWFILRGPLAIVSEPLLRYREYPSKVVAEMAEALLPGVKPQDWRKVRMWRRLWAMTADPQVSAPVRRVARTELALLPFTKWGRAHLREDLVLRVTRETDPAAGTIHELPWRWLRRQRDVIRRRR